MYRRLFLFSMSYDWYRDESRRLFHNFLPSLSLSLFTSVHIITYPLSFSRHTTLLLPSLSSSIYIYKILLRVPPNILSPSEEHVVSIMAKIKQQIASFLCRLVRIFRTAKQFFAHAWSPKEDDDADDHLAPQPPVCVCVIAKLFSVIVYAVFSKATSQFPFPTDIGKLHEKCTNRRSPINCLWWDLIGRGAVCPGYAILSLTKNIHLFHFLSTSLSLSLSLSRSLREGR